MIDPYGRVRAELDLDGTGALDADLPVAIERTVYARFGDFGFWILLFASAFIAFFVVYNRKEPN